MKRAARLGLVQAMTLLVGGVLVGGVGGFWGLLGADGTADTAELAARPYLAMLLVLPALLLLMNFSPPELAPFERANTALVAGVVAGGLGGLLAALGYFVPAGNLPSFLGGEDAGDLYDAIRGEVGLGRFLAVVLVTLAAGAAIAWVTHLRVAAYRRAVDGRQGTQ